MKKSNVIKSLFLVIFVTIFINGCSINYENKFGKSPAELLNNESQLLFTKSPIFNWKNKKVVVSFEDDFRNFNTFEKSGYILSENNLKQGITVQLKVIDFFKKSEIVNEIMIESYDLSKGVNQFTIGYNDNTPYIIY
ncbi:hypothetical protein [Flavobacterium sp. SM2513]|uniref:hypothetical protein n=1 Tax=Flavobacterium sp. SM2513 TaxID=3424766 RepID=UPI003D7F4958